MGRIRRCRRQRNSRRAARRSDQTCAARSTTGDRPVSGRQSTSRGGIATVPDFPPRRDRSSSCRHHRRRFFEAAHRVPARGRSASATERRSWPASCVKMITYSTSCWPWQNAFSLRLGSGPFSRRIEEAGLVRLGPRSCGADRVPGHNAVRAEAPGVQTPGGTLEIGRADLVRAAVEEHRLPVPRLPGQDAVAIRPQGAADDLLAADAVEQVTLPLGPRDIAAEDQVLRPAGGGEEFAAEPPQRPEILRIDRLVEDPRRRASRPRTPLGLEVDFVVEVELEGRVRPSLSPRRAVANRSAAARNSAQ